MAASIEHHHLPLPRIEGARLLIVVAPYYRQIAEGLRALAVLLSPVMPQSTEKLWIALGAAESLGRLQDQPIREAGAWGVLRPGTSVNGLSPLFPRVESAS